MLPSKSHSAIYQPPKQAAPIDPRLMSYLRAHRVTPAPESLVHPSKRVVLDLEENTYHADKSLCASLTEHLQPMLSPAQFWHYSWHNPARPASKNTIAKKFGSAAHCITLQPEKFNYTINPKVKQTIVPGQLGGAPGGEWETLQRLHEKLLNNPWVAERLAEIGKLKAFAEMSVFTTWRECGFDVPVRIRHDLWHPDFTIDFKFVREIHPRSFNRILKDYRYVHRDAWYRAVDERAGTAKEGQERWQLFVEKEGPMKILPIRFPPDEIMIAHNQNRMAVERYGECFSRYGEGPWPDYNKPMTVRREADGEDDEFKLQQNWER